jgi:hypothetical protein
MEPEIANLHNRREFLHRLAVLGGAVAFGKGAPARVPDASPAGPLPKRILGRTGANLPVLGLGLGPLGIANFPPEELQGVVKAAIEDWGRTFRGRLDPLPRRCLAPRC